MWVKILKAKYKFKCEHPTFLLHKPNCSNLWKGICSIWNDVRKGIVWSLSNGNSISFWLDAWLPDGQILPQQITLSLNESLLTRTVSSYICENGQWDWEVLGGHFQMSTLLKIANVPTPSSRESQDFLVWKLTSEGKATLRSAHLLLSNLNENDKDTVWKLM